MSRGHVTNSSSEVSVKKTVTVKPGEVIVLDKEKQKEIITRIQNDEDPAELYKKMLVDAWSMQETKSVPSKNVGETLTQPFELIVHSSRRDELPIVGYTPIYAKRFQPDRSEVVEADVKPAEEIAPPSEIPLELIQSQTSEMFKQLLEEINANTKYTTPFDKFIPHEDLLPDLQPAIAAKLVAKADIDPVRGKMGDKQKEEETLEAQLNLPEFSQVMEHDDKVRKKIQENVKFWQSISNHIPARSPTQEELKLLDFATLCNMYVGSWGMDEDTMLLQFFYKFQYDDNWRARLKKGCFSLLDECDTNACGVCPPVTDREMATMKDEHFFEIEDKDEYKDVVMNLREEFNKKSDNETNWEFMQLIMNPVDSDLDSDGFVSDDDLILCREKRPSSKEWIRAKGTWVAPAKFDVQPPDEEDQQPCDIKCEDVEVLKFKDIVPARDIGTLEMETVELMKKKLEKKKADERKGIHWRAKSNYLYRWPDFRRKTKK